MEEGRVQGQSTTATPNPTIEITDDDNNGQLPHPNVESYQVFCKRKVDELAKELELIPQDPFDRVVKTGDKSFKQKFVAKWTLGRPWLTHLPDDPFSCVCLPCSITMRSTMCSIKGHEVSKSHLDQFDQWWTEERRLTYEKKKNHKSVRGLFSTNDKKLVEKLPTITYTSKGKKLYNQKFRKAWLRDPLFVGWLELGVETNGDEHALCNICEKKLKPIKHVLITHSKSVVHINAIHQKNLEEWSESLRRRGLSTTFAIDPKQVLGATLSSQQKVKDSPKKQKIQESKSSNEKVEEPPSNSQQKRQPARKTGKKQNMQDHGDLIDQLEKIEVDPSFSPWLRFDVLNDGEGKDDDIDHLTSVRCDLCDVSFMISKPSLILDITKHKYTEAHFDRVVKWKKKSKSLDEDICESSVGN